MASLLLGIRRAPLIYFMNRSLPTLSYSSGSGFIPTDQEQATGLEKKELDALISGVDDPFNMQVQKLRGGTKENPQLVPSMYQERIVGCLCDEEDSAISWMTLHKGSPQRCDCGRWFKLIEGNPIKIDV